MAKIGNIPNVVNDPSTILDVGSFLFTCEAVKEGDWEGQILYDASFRVQQPASHQGQLHYEKWFIGSKEDPEALLPDTWTSQAGKMKKCCESMGVPFLGQNPDLVVQQMIGKQVCGKTVHKQSTKDGVNYTNARVSQWGQPGTMTPEVIGADNGQPSAPMQTETAAPMPAGTPGVGTPVAPQTGMPASPAGGQPVPAGPPLPPQYQ